MIKLKNLTAGYGKGRTRKEVIRGVNAELKCGSLTLLEGNNGIGKSTLLKTLAGFIPPLGGEVCICDPESGEERSCSSMSPGERSRIMGVVLTEREETGLLTVEEVVGMGRTPYTNIWGTLSKADVEIVLRSIKRVGLEHLAGSPVSEISDGEKQKTFIAKALAQQTPIILLDEPSAFLDYPSKEELMRLLRMLAREEKKTVLLSSHDLDMARRYADTVWRIQRKSCGTIMEILPSRQE